MKYFEKAGIGKVGTVINNNEIWFLAKDIFRICEYTTGIPNMLKLIQEESKAYIYIKEKEVLIIDINAVQKLIDYSNSACKKVIKNWIKDDIIASNNINNKLDIKSEKFSIIPVVNNINGVNVVSSRIIAEQLGKRHDHIIRDIETKITLPKFGEWFIVNEYISNNGQKYKEYLLTKDGFNLLVFGYQGYDDYKIAYIDKFNEIKTT